MWLWQARLQWWTDPNKWWISTMEVCFLLMSESWEDEQIGQWLSSMHWFRVPGRQSSAIFKWWLLLSPCLSLPEPARRKKEYRGVRIGGHYGRGLEVAHMTLFPLPWLALSHIATWLQMESSFVPKKKGIQILGIIQ